MRCVPVFPVCRLYTLTLVRGVTLPLVTWSAPGLLLVCYGSTRVIPGKCGVMNKVVTPVGLLVGLIIGGYGFYVGELDGTEPLSAGQVALVHGEYRQAIGHFEHVFEEFRRSAQVPIFAKGVTVDKLQHGFEASLGLAEAYLHLGDTRKAREHLDDAREKSYSPKLAYLAVDIAVAEEDFDRALEAMEELGKWSGKKPSFVGVYIKRARFHQRRNHCAEAKADYQRVVDSLEDSPMSSAKADLSIDFAWLLATDSEASCRDGERALAMLEPVVNFVDQRYTEEYLARVHSAVAAAHAETGDFDSAQEWGRKAEALAGSGTELRGKLQRQLNAYNVNAPWRE